MDVSRLSMLEILALVEAERARGATTIELDVLDPDCGRGLYPGETVELDGTTYIHRSLHTWVDFAERLGLRLGTPRAVPGLATRSSVSANEGAANEGAANEGAANGRAANERAANDDGASRHPLLRLAFEVLDRRTLVKGGEAGTEKYGIETDFARIRKLEDPGFVVDMHDALERVLGGPALESPMRVLAGPALESPMRVLYLGCNTGDEIELVLAHGPALRAATHVGVDHSSSAIATARARFANQPTIAFHEADITKLAALELGRFDLIISIGTLQSAGLDDRDLLRALVQDHLAAQGSLIIGVPNCRYVDGEIEYGARMKNFRQPELGLLVKDIAFYRKYLQQHHKQVFVTGKHYVLVTAVPTRGE